MQREHALGRDHAVRVVELLDELNAAQRERIAARQEAHGEHVALERAHDEVSAENLVAQRDTKQHEQRNEGARCGGKRYAGPSGEHWGEERLHGERPQCARGAGEQQQEGKVEFRVVWDC